VKQRMISLWQTWRGQAKRAKLCLALAVLALAAALLLSSGTLCYAVSSEDLVREQAVPPAAQPTRQMTGPEAPTVQETAALQEEAAEVPAASEPTKPEDDTPPEGGFVWPVTGRITSPFGERTIFGSEDFHRGLDIAVPLGTPIVAAAGGQVIWSGEKGSYGNLIQIDHGNGYVTYYAHCSELQAAEGDWVSQGQTIALAGSTGRSTGPHCHFEVLWQGERLDPQNCLP
jgi:murein DD-endopeptidase MepM/ murein hydrolase activator NlpD